jgi:hypothetical protein
MLVWASGGVPGSKGGNGMKDRYALARYNGRARGYSDFSQLFATNPIRRALITILVSVTLIVVPLALPGGNVRAVLELITVWFGVTSIVLCTPILIWCSAEEAWRWLQRRLWPTIDQLDLSPRTHNLLRRHGFITIASVERVSDSTLLLLSNMDARAVHEIRRGINVWRYLRWQANGFR